MTGVPDESRMVVEEVNMEVMVWSVFEVEFIALHNPRAVRLYTRTSAAKRQRTLLLGHSCTRLEGYLATGGDGSTHKLQSSGQGPSDPPMVVHCDEQNLSGARIGSGFRSDSSVVQKNHAAEAGIKAVDWIRDAVSKLTDPEEVVMNKYSVVSSPQQRTVWRG